MTTWFHTSTDVTTECFFRGLFEESTPGLASEAGRRREISWRNLAWPFLDVNKRVSRLVANLPLIRDNLCPLSFIDVPNRDYIDGTLGIYELNRVELLRDVFCWAYERSCARYSAVRQSLGEPDPFRLRYRRLIVSAYRKAKNSVLEGLSRREIRCFVPDTGVECTANAR